MFKKEMKLPETKLLLQVNDDFQRLICFLESGLYEGNILCELENAENIISKYRGNILFNESGLLTNLEYFINNICSYAHDGYVKLSKEEVEGFHNIAHTILREYYMLMNKYKEEYR